MIFFLEMIGMFRVWFRVDWGRFLRVISAFQRERRLPPTRLSLPTPVSCSASEAISRISKNENTEDNNIDDQYSAYGR